MRSIMLSYWFDWVLLFWRSLRFCVATSNIIKFALLCKTSVAGGQHYCGCL